MLTQEQYNNILQMLKSPDEDTRQLGVSLLETDKKFASTFLDDYEIIIDGRWEFDDYRDIKYSYYAYLGVKDIHSTGPMFLWLPNYDEYINKKRYACTIPV